MTRSTMLALIGIGDVVLKLLIVVGVAALAWAVVNERRMHRHRRPGVSYGEATMRRDGGWRREDLFTEDGLRFQRRASTWGVGGAILLVLAIILAWVLGMTMNLHGAPS
jgi:threonine/homoserine/homoserine lactone efflux protein